MNAPRRWVRVLRSRPRLWLALGVGAAVYAGLQFTGSAEPASRALWAWNACAAFYLLAVVHMAFGATPARIERRGVRQADGRVLAVAVVVLAAVAVLLAVFSQLASVKTLPGPQKLPHVALAALTVASSWLFTHTVFAVQYAHDFYLSRAIGRDDVLIFPGTKEPTYGDFMYFACVIGTSGQTADVAFNGRTLRPVGTLHCVLAYAFNVCVLGLAISVAVGLA